MSTVDSINEEVQRELSRRHKDIVLGVYRFMLRKHNDGSKCGCNYCIKLKEYVESIRRFQRVRRTLEYEYEFRGYTYIDLDAASRNMRVLKQQKDALKLV